MVGVWVEDKEPERLRGERWEVGRKNSRKVDCFGGDYHFGSEWETRLRSERG